MPYPRHLNLDEEVEKDLVAWTETEIVNHLGERTNFIERIKRYQSDYIAEPQTEVSKIPFLGASSIIVPLTAIALEAVHSRTMQTLFSLEQKIAVKIHNPELEDLSSELEVFLNNELMEGMDFKKKVEPAILELEKLGTGVIETSYVDEVRKGIKTDLDTGKEKEFEVVVRRGPSVDSTPISNFLQPFDDLDTQTSRWCGKVFWHSEHEVRQKEQDGYFKDGTHEYLESKFLTTTNDIDDAGGYKKATETITDTQPSWPKLVEFYFMATCWEVVKDSGRYDEIFYVYQRDTRKIVSIWYNWFEDLRRPFRHGVYFPLEFRWYGIGIAKQNEQFQYEVTAQHRARLDNSTIANMRMWKVNRNLGLKPDEPIFPGKFWYVDDPNDIMPMEMGDVKSSAYNNENQVTIYSQQRTGVNELTLGMPNVGTPGTATDSMARVQESARKSDYTGSNTKNFINEVIQDSLCNIVQWGPRIERLKFSPKAREIEDFLKNPYVMFRDKILCTAQLAGQNQNKFRDRQDATQLVGILQQYYTSSLALVTQLQDPEAAKIALTRALEGANLAMKHIMQSFDIRNPDKLLIQVPTPNNGPSQSVQPNGSGSIGPSSINQTSPVQFNNISAPGAQSIFPGNSMPG